MDFYKPEDAQYPLSQGDLLYPIPFAAFRISGVDIRYEQSTRYVDLTTDEHKQGDLVASFETSWGLVINQSCDLEPQKDEPLIVAQVVARQKLYPKYKDENPKDIEEFIKNRFNNAGQAPARFYLPAFAKDDFIFPRSIALLCRVQNFAPVDRDTLLGLRKFSLSGDALDSLQEKLAYTFGRFASPSHLFYSQEEWNYKENKKGKAQAIPEQVALLPEHQEFKINEPGLVEKAKRIIKRFLK